MATPREPNAAMTLGTASHGDVSCVRLERNTGGSITNPDVSSLSIRAPNDGSVQVTRNALTRITSVRTGNIYAVVTTSPTSTDPKAIQITFSNDLLNPTGSIFRTTKIENLTDPTTSDYYQCVWGQEGWGDILLD